MMQLDMCEAGDVAWIKARRSGAVARGRDGRPSYRGDAHGFLDWLIAQPDMDRAIAGWMFLWPEGSRYLRGETDFPLNHVSSGKMVALFDALCRRSESLDFTQDRLGLDPDFEPERKACLDVVASGKVAAGIVAPVAIIARPYVPPRKGGRFMLDDGLILSS